MTLEHIPRPRIIPEQMTGRAQAYLTVAGLRHAAIGGACLAAPAYFTSPGYQQIKGIPGGLITWGVVSAAVGVMCLAAAVLRSENLARFALLSSAVVTGLWAAGFWLAMFHGTIAGPTGPAIWTAVTAKDLIVCRQPLRSPFEPLIRELLGRRSARGRTT